MSQEHTVIIHCDTVTLSHDSQEDTMIIHCDTVHVTLTVMTVRNIP